MTGRIIIFSIFAAAFAGFLFSPVLCSTTTAADISSFMSLESSIKELEELVNKSSPGVVLVVSYDESGAESGRGSGFFIDGEGRIITNAAVMKNAYSAEVFSGDGHYEEVLVLDRIEDLDIALIQITTSDAYPLKIDADYEIKAGERVVVLGRSGDSGGAVSEGLISSVHDREGERSVLLNIELTRPLLSFPASKDGPLLNMAGKVVGLTSTSLSNHEESDGIPRMSGYEEMKAVSITGINSFFADSPDAERLKRAKSRVWIQWFVRWIKTAAVSTFIILYGIGFPKLLASALIIIIMISIVQWIYVKLKQGLSKK